MEEAFGRAGRDEPAALSRGPPDQPVTASLSLFGSLDRAVTRLL